LQQCLFPGVTHQDWYLSTWDCLQVPIILSPREHQIHADENRVVQREQKNGKIVSNDQVVEQIKELLAQEFVDYGYLKVTHWLRQNKGYIISKHKVYRLMKKYNLLNLPTRSNPVKRLWVQDLVPNTTTSFEYLEIDIKYVYVHAIRRNSLSITVIDVESRWVLGQFMAWRINKGDVKALFNQIFQIYELPSKIYVRNDNGSQFIAATVQAYFESFKVVQEFIKPATPEQNAHIESYHSIVERVICQQYQFSDLKEAQDTFNRFVMFYNYERIHSGVNYLSPYAHLISKHITLPDKEKLLTTALNCQMRDILPNEVMPLARRRVAEAHSIGKPS